MERVTIGDASYEHLDLIDAKVQLPAIRASEDSVILEGWQPLKSLIF